MAEYTEIYGVFTWTKGYTYLGDTQLATITPSGGGEAIEFNHPDNLRLTSRQEPAKNRLTFPSVLRSMPNRP